MKNVKGFAVASDGNMKRIAITYDEIDSFGKITNPNAKSNRIINNADILAAVAEIEKFAMEVIETE